MLRFIKTTSEDPTKLLTWDRVSFEDGKEREQPIKKIVLTVEAGGIATLAVERYAMGNLFTAVSDKPEDDYKPLTYITHYGVSEIKGDFKIGVVGPFGKIHGKPINMEKNNAASNTTNTVVPKT